MSDTCPKGTGIGCTAFFLAIPILFHLRMTFSPFPTLALGQSRPDIKGHCCFKVISSSETQSFQLPFQFKSPDHLLLLNISSSLSYSVNLLFVTDASLSPKDICPADFICFGNFHFYLYSHTWISTFLNPNSRFRQRGMQKGSWFSVALL